MTSQSRKTGIALLMVLSVGATGVAQATPLIDTYDKRSEFRQAILSPEWTRDREGFNRVKTKKRGGQRSFARSPLDLDGFTMAMQADDGVRVPKGKRNRVTKRPRFRLNRTKYAWVKTRTGVDLTLTFDAEINAFGAKFRGLNNKRASTTILLDNGEARIAELAPPETRKRKRSFLGFVSDTAFKSITFSGHDAFGMDRLLWASKVGPLQSTPAVQTISIVPVASGDQNGATPLPDQQLADGRVPALPPLLLLIPGIAALLLRRRSTSI